MVKSQINVSFDFDGCLTRRSVKKVAKGLSMDPRFEVFILTSRGGDLSTNGDVRKMAKSLNIPNKNVIFVGGWKNAYFQDNPAGIDIHIDDYHFELQEIRKINPNIWCIPCDLTLFFEDFKNE